MVAWSVVAEFQLLDSEAYIIPEEVLTFSKDC